MDLRPCPGCNRHVLVSNDACPFCGSALAIEPAIAKPASGLGRAALIAFAAVAACHDEPKQTVPDPTPSVTASAAATQTATQTATATASAAPSVTASASAVASAAPVDAGVKDAGKKTAATATVTATATMHNIAKPYGAPPARASLDRDRRTV